VETKERLEPVLEELEPVRFRFKGKIARLLGRESVSNAIVALTELVKNAYDADATLVVVAFEGVTKSEGRIRIIDNGTGMTYEEFKERWMVVGTDYKERKRVTPSGRIMVGEKGIGRFAVERLARRVEIISKVKGKDTQIRVLIDWDQYESEKSFFDAIENKVFLESKKDPSEHGLELILSELRDKWDASSLQEFMRQMNILIPPVEFARKDFVVEVRTPEFPDLSGEIQSLIFREAFYTLTATLESSGKATYEVVDRDGKRSVETFIDTEKTPQCGPIKFKLYFYPRGFAKDEKVDYKVLDLAEVRAILDNFHGIRIYRDGFRVKPYGDPGNDWLDLNSKRLIRPGRLFPDNRQVIGIVEIFRDKNPDLIDTTTREGLIRNRAFSDMFNFLERAVEYLSIRRRKDRKEEKPPVTVIRAQVERINSAIKRSNIPIPIKNRVLLTLKGIEESALGLVMVYRNLASLGITVLGVAHEITNPISTILNYSEALLIMVQTGEVDIDQLEKAAKNIRSNILRISEFIDFVVAYNRRKRRKRLKTDLREVLNGVLDGYRAIFQKRGISLITEIDKEPKEVFIYRGDFESILINLITNSLEALRFKSGKRIIKVSLMFDSEAMHLRFSDNGRGIPIENRELIFEPFFTTKEDGTGVGLKIIREIVQEYGGSVQVLDSELENGATFKVEIATRSMM